MKSKRETIEMAKLALFNSQTKLEVLEKQKQELLGKYANANEEEKPELEEQMKIINKNFKIYTTKHLFYLRKLNY